MFLFTVVLAEAVSTAMWRTVCYLPTGRRSPRSIREWSFRAPTACAKSP